MTRRTGGGAPRSRAGPWPPPDLPSPYRDESRQDGGSPMVITRERLAGAMTPEQYIAQMRENRELFEANLAAARFTAEERAPFEALPRPLTVLVLTEDWCGDSNANLPMVVALARQTGKLDLRILTREGNEDIADRYQLADGRNHIPTYIVLDEELGEIGHFIERPAALTEKLGEFRRDWFAAHP